MASLSFLVQLNWSSQSWSVKRWKGKHLRSRKKIWMLFLLSASRSLKDHFAGKWRPWLSHGKPTSNIDCLANKWYMLIIRNRRLKDFFFEDSTCVSDICDSLCYKKCCNQPTRKFHTDKAQKKKRRRRWKGKTINLDQSTSFFFS